MEARCIGLGHELANDFTVADEKLALHEEDVVDWLARALARSQMDDVAFSDPVAFDVACNLGIDVAYRLESE